jgi:acyl carrier protein
MSERTGVALDGDIQAVLAEIFFAVFGREDLTFTPALAARDVPGWDSFKQIEIILAIEERYGIQLNSQEIDNLHNVADLISVVTYKTSKTMSG